MAHPQKKIAYHFWVLCILCLCQLSGLYSQDQQVDDLEKDKILMNEGSDLETKNLLPEALAKWSEIKKTSYFWDLAQSNMERIKKKMGVPSQVPSSNAAKSGDRKKPPPLPGFWSLGLELGAGSIAAATVNRRVGSFEFGGGFGIDQGFLDTGYTNASSWLFHPHAHAIFHFIDLHTSVVKGVYRISQVPIFQLSARLKVGYDVISLGELWGGAFDITPEILVGVYNFYVIFSGAITIFKTVAFTPSIGLGYRVFLGAKVK